MDNLKKWKSDPSKGEVFTPIELVNLILDKIPSDVWTNPSSTFLDPCMGTGTFLSEIVRRLVDIYGYSELDAKSRVYGYEIRVKYINKLKRRGYVNLQHKDFLCDEIKMKFDVVIGNPPYQKQVGPKKTQPIWPDFVKKSLDLCKEGGYVSLIHPNGWRNVDGIYKEIQTLIKSKEVVSLNMFSDKDGMNIFNASINFDIYLIKNSKNSNSETKIITHDKNTIFYNINNLEFIPNGDFEKVLSLVAKENEEKVLILHSYSDYETRKPYMSKIKTINHVYPCVSNVTKSEEIKVLYSSTKSNGHFGIPKLICGSASSGTNFFVDENGDYGITQFSFGIIDDKENLNQLKKVLKSDSFQKIVKNMPNNSNSINYKILSTFRKDFWKEFLDENGNVKEI